ncbi:MAG: helix-turn-helix transcriptional regulator [Phenylobacterium sp.]|nr:helix-turn-helix transcriptional regulator [Phenylobacterium sp.]
MDGVEFYRTTADGGVRRILPAGRNSYCVMLRKGRLDLEIEYPKVATLTLNPGDVVAVSGLAAHAFVPPGAQAATAPFARGPMDEAPVGASELIIGVVPSEPLALGSLMLGPILIRPDEDPGRSRQVWRAAEMLEDEYLAGPSPDHALVVRRLAELMMINFTRQAVRDRNEQDGPALAAGVERQIVKALDAFLDAPDRHWDLPSLARTAGMSRTRFAQTFKAVTGETPALMLTRLKLGSIAHRLTNESLSVEAAAEAAGYSSAAAFVRAFRRVHGDTPARWRRRAGQGEGVHET